MDQQRRSPSIQLISASSPARPVSTTPSPTYQQSQSPFRYVQLSTPEPSPTLLSDFTPERKRTASPRRISRPNSPDNSPATPLPRYAYPSPVLRQPNTATHLRGHRICSALRPWTPIILYALTSLGFVVAIAFYKTEVFALLDELSHWLQADAEFGYAVLGFLIFITTIPPFPLYSTLIILAGYTFGAWTGAVISYIAALTGALAVFIVSRAHFHESISRWLSCTPTLKRVVRAVEKRPKLLFLIRLAPYPYNVMNCLLAAAPTLSLRTYTVCTALSLFKVIIHTSMGASIHSFKDYHVGPDAKHDANHYIADVWTILGLVLCVGILVYLSIVARRAVDEELDDELAESSEERIAFLSQASYDIESSGISAAGPQMTQSPFRIQPFSSHRPS